MLSKKCLESIHIRTNYRSIELESAVGPKEYARITLRLLKILMKARVRRLFTRL